MPKTAKTSRKRTTTRTRNHTKRHGRHHKKTSRYVKTYAPYIPLLISILASIFLSFWNPQRGNTLAYATEMSAGALLASTNTYRSDHGAKPLAINSRLSNAAQAKAADMIARNYWSHTTPDGKEPWVFIGNAGYDYLKAGENLAYGFASSAETVVGWMNSPSHKANMLDKDYTEVGFGFANGSNFNGDGKQTVVVAMYGKPQTAAGHAPSTTKPKVRSDAATPNQAQAADNTPVAPAGTQEVSQNAQPDNTQTKKEEKPEEESENAPVNTDLPMGTAAPTSMNISKGQTLTGGKTPWILAAAAITTILAIIIMLLHHSLKLRHLISDAIHNTEKFILHHPLLESTLLGLAILGAVLSRTVGTVL